MYLYKQNVGNDFDQTGHAIQQFRNADKHEIENKIQRKIIDKLKARLHAYKYVISSYLMEVF